ncbi:sulfotransferase domain-containing protein [uncultured Marivirga sp.]|uniref:sulfotransferase family protein n=1 Tax=uncultured Marivirga sp. TaxID=1123707 RepID=UPI0030ECCF10|tara:strand:- start:27868 stop:28776 length:909 start_codon:yes stop_codon:yes gene_type:complete
MTVKPNFLIVGMAKCGTSSLAQYLQQHPNVFITKHKEPRYFSSQCMQFPMGGPKDKEVEKWYVKDWNKYLEMFSSAKEKAIGEASADTLYFHSCTIPLIKEKLGNPKIIIILRNPVKRAFSAYQHLIRDEREKGSFEDALQKEPERIRDNYELIYHYKKVSQYYEPVKAFLDNFEHVKVILNEDLQNDTGNCLKEVFQFLDVNPEQEIKYDLKFNVSGKPKNRVLHESLQGETKIRKMIRPFARLILPTQEKRMRMVTWLSGKNMNRLQLENETATDLYNFFQEDISKLKDLLKKDLSQWEK